MDLIADFAFPLPITVICELLGIPKEDRQQFRAWSQLIVVGPLGPQPDQALAALEEFIQYIKRLLADKRSHPGNDLTSGLVQVEEQGDRLSEDELISMVWLLIIAGHETTVNLIGNSMLALLRHPQQLELLRANPSLLPSAVEELLRYTAPVSLSTPRWASEDVVIHDQVIRKGKRCSSPSLRRILILLSSLIPRDWMLHDRRISMSPSARASTIAWAHHWRGWRVRLQSVCCCNAFLICA